MAEDETVIRTGTGVLDILLTWCECSMSSSRVSVNSIDNGVSSGQLEIILDKFKNIRGVTWRHIRKLS